MKALHLLKILPFVTAQELANIGGMSMSTAQRRTGDPQTWGLATCLEAGKVGHHQRRWYLTEEGLKHPVANLVD